MAEQRFPKAKVEGSNPSTPANLTYGVVSIMVIMFACDAKDEGSIPLQLPNKCPHCIKSCGNKWCSYNEN